MTDLLTVARLAHAGTRVHVLVTFPDLDWAPLVDADGWLTHLDSRAGTVTADLGAGRSLPIPVTGPADVPTPAAGQRVRVLPPPGNVTPLRPRRPTGPGGAA